MQSFWWIEIARYACIFVCTFVRYPGDQWKASKKDFGGDTLPIHPTHNHTHCGFSEVFCIVVVNAFPPSKGHYTKWEAPKKEKIMMAQLQPRQQQQHNWSLHRPRRPNWIRRTGRSCWRITINFTFVHLIILLYHVDQVHWHVHCNSIWRMGLSTWTNRPILPLTKSSVGLRRFWG